ncbi:MAG: mandelate racemase/muconate lactonizing enzyme family protein [Haloechinothrix sp.]
MTALVDQVVAYPLVHSLPRGGYGSARGRVTERTTVLVQLTTSDGAVGWGEAFGPQRALLPLVEEAASAILRRPVTDVRPRLTQLRQHTYHRGSDGIHVAAAGALDTAAWDALGRTLGLSVARLLGGRARDTVTAYASTGYVTKTQDLDEFREMLQQAREAGYPGAKIKLGLGRSEDRRRAEAARDILGPDRALMVDFNGNYTADLAVRVLTSLEDLDVAWAEEPVPVEDLAGLRRVAARSAVPIATGEATYTRHGFAALLDTGAVDVLQPDVTKCGGLTDAHFVAGMARLCNVRLSPHCWGGAVALAATLQLLAAIPNHPHPDIAPEPLWLEHDQGENPLRDELCGGPLPVAAGIVTVPDGPGLGVDVDQKVLRTLIWEQP